MFHFGRKLLKPRFIVYGTRTLNHIMQAGPTAGVHSEHDTLDAAKGWLVKQVFQYSPAVITAVIVRLLYGEDRNGEREVVHRTNDQAKAWWE